MGLIFFHLFVVFVSCMAVIYAPSSSFEFFRNLFILSASMGYDFWCTYTAGKTSQANWYKIIGLLGFVFFLILFAISLMGLTNMLEVSSTETGNWIFATSNSVMFDFSASLRPLIFLIVVVPTFLVASEFLVKPKTTERRKTR